MSFCLSVCVCTRALSLKWCVFENRHQVFNRCENEMRLPQNAFGIIVYRSFKMRCDICVVLCMSVCLSPDHICSTARSTLHSDHCYYLHLMCCSCFQCVFYSFTAAAVSPRLLPLALLHPAQFASRMLAATISNDSILTHILYVSNSPRRITLACDYHDKNRHAPCNILIYISAESDWKCNIECCYR